MIPRLRTAVLFPLSAPRHPSAVPPLPATLERADPLPDAPLSVAQKSGEALVDMKGAATAVTPGRPDLPVAERDDRAAARRAGDRRRGDVARHRAAQRLASV